MRERFLGLAAVVVLAGAVLAADPPAAAPDPLADARRVLDQPGDFVYENQPLAAVVADLKERAKLPIRIDPTVAQVGIDPNGSTVTVTVRGVKFRDGLKAVLEPLGLHFGLVRGGVLISTEDGLVTKQMRQRVAVDHAGTPFAAAAKALAAETGANVVLDPRLKDLANAPVVLKLDDVPLETAVRLLAEVADLKAVRMSNVLFVTTPARAEKLRPDADGPVPGGHGGGVFPMPIEGGIGGPPPQVLIK